MKCVKSDRPMKWKDKLLSSSLPLEYEIGKILTNENFSIDFDYSYKRYDNALEKEFSFDIRAGGFYPFEMEARIQMTIDLMVECKYRNPNTSWLFIKDINPDEFSNFTQKGVIKFIDEFTNMTSSNQHCDFPICETCLKGMEINTQNGEVHDSGIIHGVNQLLYGIPLLLSSHIEGNLGLHLSEAYPHIICPILLTTADLRILNDEFSIESVKNAKSLDDISFEVPFLRLYSGVYPSLNEHCKNVFKDIPAYDDHLKRLDYLRILRETKYLSKDKLPRIIYNKPDYLLLDLKEGLANNLLREVLVCNLKNFPELLKQIKTGITSIGEGLEEIKLIDINN
jgi:hypothetical protein